MIYVDCDASFAPHLGLAAIAYSSTVLGNRRQVVRAECSTEAEIRAVLMAMYDHRGHPQVTVRTDSCGAVNPEKTRTRRPALRAVRKRLLMEVDERPEIRVEHVKRERVPSAHLLARRTRRIAERVFLA